MCALVCRVENSRTTNSPSTIGIALLRERDKCQPNQPPPPSSSSSSASSSPPRPLSPSPTHENITSSTSARGRYNSLSLSLEGEGGPNHPGSSRRFAAARGDTTHHKLPCYRTKIKSARIHHRARCC